MKKRITLYCYYIPKRKFFITTLLLTTLVLAAFLSACKHKGQTPIPSGILQNDQMVQVITDIHLAEAKRDLLMTPDSLVRAPINVQKIFDEHHVAKSQYEQSLKFYVEHPELMNKVYDDVLNGLNKKQAESSKK